MASTCQWIPTRGLARPIAEAAAERASVPPVLVAPAIWSGYSPSLMHFKWNHLPVESGFGGIAHACEMETSLGLYLFPELIDMSRAVREDFHPQNLALPSGLVCGRSRHANH